MIFNSKQSRLWGMAMASLLLLGARAVNATVIAEAASTFDWDSLTLGLDPGMSLTLVDREPQFSSASAFTYFSSSGVFDSDSSFASDWSTNLDAAAISTSATYELSATGRVDADNDTMTGAASFNGSGVFYGTGNELLKAQGGTQRDFRFIVSGEGVISFSVDYIHDTSASNTGPDVGVAVAVSGLSLNNLSNGNGISLDPDLPDEAVATVYTNSYADALLGESVFDSDFGTISLRATVADGAEMLFSAQAFSAVFYEVPRQAVPEPVTLLLMGLGTAGLAYTRRRNVQGTLPG